MRGAGQDGAMPEPAPGFKKKYHTPSHTRLLNLNPIPLGTGRGGYPKKPASLPSLFKSCYFSPTTLFWVKAFTPITKPYVVATPLLLNSPFPCSSCRLLL